MPGTSRTTNQPQYDLQYWLFRSNVDLPHPVFAVFELPDELILSILSHVSPDPRFTSYYSQFHLPPFKSNDHHRQRMRFLRRLSTTCRAMWLRLRPWMWERLECLKFVPPWGSPEKLKVIMKHLRADVSLVTCVRYFYHLLSLWVGADSRPLKVPDNC